LRIAQIRRELMLWTMSHVSPYNTSMVTGIEATTLAHGFHRWGQHLHARVGEREHEEQANNAHLLGANPFLEVPGGCPGPSGTLRWRSPA
jgi:hypothetical protein